MAAAAMQPPASRGGCSRGGASGSLQATLSMPTLGRMGMSTRGEHGFGTVRGFEDVQEDLYVPRASWTESFSSPLRQRHAGDSDAEQWVAEANVAAAHKNCMTRYINQEVGKQMGKQDTLRRTMTFEGKSIQREQEADQARWSQEIKSKQERHKTLVNANQKGLAEQVAVHVQKAQDQRLQHVAEGNEVKMRTLQQLNKEIMAAHKKKEHMKQEMLTTVSAMSRAKSQQKLDRDLENAEVRRNMGDTLKEEGSLYLAQRQRVKDAMASQEAFYSHFSGSTEDQERRDREARRQEKDELTHQMRMDQHYAQRELARERQRHRMIQTLANQVEANAKKNLTERIRQDFERNSVNDSALQGRDTELQKQRNKRAEELENQALLIAQMHEKQQRAKSENPHYRPAPAAATMLVTPGLLASADAWLGTGAGHAASGAPDLVHQLDAAKHLAKPCGRPEPKPDIKPWIDIARSQGLGGVTGVFGSEGPTRSILMSTGGPARVLTKAASLAARDGKMQRAWQSGVSPEELKAGRKAAARRQSASAADKSLVP